MSKALLASGLLLSSSLLIWVAANDGNFFPRCNCDDEGSLWNIEAILWYQKEGEFVIAVAYFSIPVVLLYYLSFCSKVPFKFVLFEFIAITVLCGLTHFLHGWTHSPRTFHFQLMLAHIVFKILTASASSSTAISLFTLIPMLLKVKVREFLLKQKTWDLGRQVGIIMKQKEAGLRVCMLTQDIKKSLDRHTILDTTLFELSKTLKLQNCAVWMPNEMKTEMIFTHKLNEGGYSNMDYCCSIPITNPDVVRIIGSDGVNILRPNSAIAFGFNGSAATIRLHMLSVCNFKKATPEMNQYSCYAILALVLPGGQPHRP